MSQRISRDELLDALGACVLQVGVRRTTFAEVARRGGVSRMTLYRNFGDVRGAVAALMTREFSALLAAAHDDAAGRPTGRDRLVEAAVLVVERLAAHPLFRRVVELDPELLLPYVVDRLGATQRAAIGHFAETVAAGQADRSIRPDADPAVAAYVLAIAGQSFALSARVTAAEHEPAAVTAELRELLDAYLRPAPVAEPVPAATQSAPAVPTQPEAAPAEPATAPAEPATAPADSMTAPTDAGAP